MESTIFDCFITGKIKCVCINNHYCFSGIVVNDIMKDGFVDTLSSIVRIHIKNHIAHQQAVGNEYYLQSPICSLFEY